MEDGVLIVPVVEEEIVAEKRLRLKEGLRVRRISEAEPLDFPVLLRGHQAAVTPSAGGAACGPLFSLGAMAVNCTVTAFSPSRQRAEQVRSRLTGLGVPERYIAFVTSDAHRQFKDDQGGFLGLLERLFIPNKDRFVDAEGRARGEARHADRAFG
jgi:hypothetical protein